MRTPSATITCIAISFAILGGVALAAQDRSTLNVPNGLSFSEFKGYQDWQYVAVSQTESFAEKATGKVAFEKTPPLSAEIAKKLLSQWPTPETAAANRRQ